MESGTIPVEESHGFNGRMEGHNMKGILINSMMMLITGIIIFYCLILITD
jgi:hypothetical protein